MLRLGRARAPHKIMVVHVDIQLRSRSLKRLPDYSDDFLTRGGKRVFVLTTMAASPVAPNGSGTAQQNEKWTSHEDVKMESMPPNGEATNGSATRPDDHPQAIKTEHTEDSPAPSFSSGSKADAAHRGEKQIKVLVRSHLCPL